MLNFESGIWGRERLPQDQKRDRKEEQEMKTGMRLDDGMRDFLRYLAAALCSTIMTYLTTSPQPQERNRFSDDGHWESLFAKDL